MTLRANDSTKLQATAFGCAGTVAITTSWTWSTKDSAIVRVDASSGWVYGVRAGATQVLGVTNGLPNATAVLSIVTVVP